MAYAEYVIGCVFGIVLGILIGAFFIGYYEGKAKETQEVIRQCEKSGYYSTDGVVVHCPSVLNNKEQK